jgi:hypothetical protein
VALCAAVLACGSERSGLSGVATPVAPSLNVTSTTQSVGAGPIVSWRCLAATSSWHPTDCVRSATSVVRLAVGAALSAPLAPVNLTGSASGNRVTLAWLGPAGGDAPTSNVIEAGSASGLADVANADTGSATPALIARWRTDRRGTKAG